MPAHADRPTRQPPDARPPDAPPTVPRRRRGRATEAQTEPAQPPEAELRLAPNDAADKQRFAIFRWLFSIIGQYLNACLNLSGVLIRQTGHDPSLIMRTQIECAARHLPCRRRPFADRPAPRPRILADPRADEARRRDAQIAVDSAQRNDIIKIVVVLAFVFLIPAGTCSLLFAASLVARSGSATALSWRDPAPAPAPARALEAAPKATPHADGTW